MGKWIEHALHHHWEVYEGVEVGVVRCIGYRGLKALGK